MEPIKLIVMDMDGTLLIRGVKGIPKENEEALRLASEQGVKLAICSGRMPDDLSLFAINANLPMAIMAANGGCVLDAPLGNVIVSSFIDADVAAKILPMVNEAGLLYGMFSEHILLTNAADEAEAQRSLTGGCNIGHPGCRTEVWYRNEGAEKVLHRANKFIIIDHNNVGTLAALKARIAELFPQVEISSSGSNNIEINPKGVNKGQAITAMCEQLGIKLNEVMALGDNDNDVPMLKLAGYGVCMGNSSEAAIAASDYITPPNTEFGVACGVRKLVLGEDVAGVKKL